VYDKSIHETFEKVVRRDMVNPSEVLMKRATARFDEKGREYDAWLETGKSNDYAEHRAELMHKKEMAKQRAKHEAEFMETWNQINEEQWRKNQQRARDRKQTYAKVHSDVSNRAETARIAREQHARDSTLTGIDEFEERLRTRTFVPDSEDNVGMAIKTAGGQGEEGLPELMHMDVATLDAGLLVSQKTIKQNYDEFLEKQQVHGRRRRKYIRERESFHYSNIQKAAQNEIIYQLLNKSTSEKVEESAMTRVMTNRDVIRVNAENRSRVVSEVRTRDAEAAKEWFVEEARREHAWVVKSRIDAQRSRLDKFRTAKRCADAQYSREVAQDSIDRLLDVVDWVCSTRAIGSFSTKKPVPPAPAEADPADEGAPESAPEDPLAGEVIPVALWKDVVQMFLAPLPMGSAMPYPTPNNVYEELPSSLSNRPNMALPSWLVDQGTTTGPDALKLTEEGLDASVSADIYANILNVDLTDFLESFCNADVGGTCVPETEAPGQGEPLPEEDLKFNIQKVLMQSPAWLAVTPSNRVLGRVIAELRCVAAPLPPDPVPSVEQTTRSVRLALGGASDRARDSAAAAIATETGATIINAQDVVRAAAARGAEIAAAKAAGDWVDEPETATAPEPEEGPEPEEPEPKLEPVDGEGEDAEGNDAALEGETPEAAPADEPPVESEAVEADDADAARESEPETGAGSEPVGPVLPDKGSADYEALEKARLLRKNKNDLCLLAHTALVTGLCVADSTVAGLIAHEVSELPEGTGFVVVDFARTKGQMVALLQALSGIDYTQKRPTLSDKASSFATVDDDSEVASYDVTKCGLDAVIIINADSEELMLQRMQMRLDLNRRGPGVDIAEAETCVTEATKDVGSLAEPFTPLRPVHSTAVTNESFADCDASLKQFLSDMQLLRETTLSLSLTWAEDSYPDAAAEKLTAEKVVAIVKEVYAPPAAVEAEGGEPTEAGVESKATEEASAPVEGGAYGEGESAFVPAVLPTVVEKIKVNKALATALTDMWQLSEDQSKEAALDFFRAMRDIRFNLLHRRRAVFDSVHAHTIRRGNHQEAFEAFRDSFNAIDDEFRFDAEVRAELTLQATQLRNDLDVMADNRKAECVAVLKALEADGMVKLLQHRTRCEGAAMLQAEISRFNAALHLMQDYAKASAGYEANSQFVNELEETLPMSDDGGAAPAGKDKGKGGKGDTPPAPFRAVLPSLVLEEELMKAIPQPGVEEEEADPKAKGKGKKGEPEVAQTPLETAAAACMALATAWDRENFVANRALYGQDERLCVILENAVWVEANRVKASVELVKDLTNSQVEWLAKCEADGIILADGLINSAYARELANVERLTAEIMVVIRDCLPITTDWLVAADAMAVRENVLLKARPAPAPAPVLEEYDALVLSDTQKAVALRALQLLCLGGVVSAVPAAAPSSSSDAGVLLLQDALTWADKSRGATGPLSSATLEYGSGEGALTGELQYLQFPVGWRDLSSTGDDVLASLVTSKSAVSLADSAGVTNPHEVLGSIDAFASKAALNAGNGWTGTL